MIYNTLRDGIVSSVTHIGEIMLHGRAFDLHVGTASTLCCRRVILVYRYDTMNTMRAFSFFDTKISSQRAGYGV